MANKFDGLAMSTATMKTRNDERDLEPSERDRPVTRRTRLEPLFEAELRYRPDMDPVAAADEHEGELIGSGDGTVRGDRICGTILWTFYSVDCVLPKVLAGQPLPPGLHLCKENPGGYIETEDGARIRFDARGFGLRGPDPKRPRVWRLTMGLQFSTDDSRYAWINTTLAVWDGIFDETMGRAWYRAYAALDSGDGSA